MYHSDAMERPGSVLEVAKSACRRFDEERCFQLAGSLTYTTLLALVPLMTVVLSLGTMFPMFRDWMAHLDVWFEKNVLPEQIAGPVAGYISQFAAAAARLTVFGVILLAATAVMMMMTIDNGLSQIFRIWRPRSLAQQVLIYWAVLTLGPVLMSASISLTSVLVSASFGLTKGMPLLHFVVLRIVPFLLTTTAYTLIYLPCAEPYSALPPRARRRRRGRNHVRSDAARVRHLHREFCDVQARLRRVLGSADLSRLALLRLDDRALRRGPDRNPAEASVSPRGAGARRAAVLRGTRSARRAR
jgi:YihY family inner membrane protein